jgi:hypothetical protein
MNNPINFIDGVYCKFHCVSNGLVIGKPIGGYKNLSIKDTQKTVSYLARNIKSDGNSDWEMGIGEVKNIDGFIVVTRKNIISSSNNNELVSFSGLNDPSFCIIPNQYSFNTGFNNIITKNDDFNAENIKATYYIDNSNKDIKATLPPASDSSGLIIEFKSIASEHSVSIYTSEPDLIDNQPYIVLSSVKQYTRLASTGHEWIELINNSSPISRSVPYAIMSEVPPPPPPPPPGPPVSGLPGGDPFSLQFNAINGFDGLPAYYSSGNLLIGGDSISTALDIIPLYNDSNTIFNNLNGSGNFIVHGLPKKNLFFDSAGKLGINIPSGLQPAAALHINNNGCVDGIRLDNNNSCYPATLTLFHRPSTIPTSNSIASVINLAGKNSVNSQINYVQLKSKILNSTIGSTQGQLIVTVENSGQQKEVMLLSPNRFTVAVGNSSIDLSPSGTIITGAIRLSDLNLDDGIVVFSGLSSDNSPSSTATPTPTVSLTSTPTPTPTITPTPRSN